MTVHDYSVRTAEGEEQSLEKFAGNVMLIVNTATQCGFASQFKGLERLYRTHKKDGFVVLGFPCNQFMNQEPVANENMQETCERDFGVTFPLFAKIDVNGTDADPLYKFLKTEEKGVLGDRIKWNFTKFLVDQDGNVVGRYGSTVEPEKIEEDIKKLIK